MPVKKRDSVLIPLQVLTDKRLSPKAKGLLCIILTYPKNWTISITALCATSENVGKKAIQSGLKELATCGYLQLNPIYDKGGKFRGRKYQRVEAAIFGEDSPDLRTIPKGCFPNQKAPQNRTTPKADVPKMVFSAQTQANKLKINGKPQNGTDNTKRVSTRLVDCLDNNQLIKDKPKTGFSVTDFSPTLLKDTAWQNAFIGQLLADQSQLTAIRFSYLLQHFSQTSLRLGTRYEDILAVKKHFFNWYQLHLSKKSLIGYIQQEEQTQRSTRQRVFELVHHSENIFTKLKGRAYQTEQDVLRGAKALQKHQATYQQCLPHVLTAQDKSFLTVLIADIEQMIGKVNRAATQGQLSWFCRVAK